MVFLKPRHVGRRYLLWRRIDFQHRLSFFELPPALDGLFIKTGHLRPTSGT
jgi:hypothetical protein